MRDRRRPDQAQAEQIGRNNLLRIAENVVPEAVFAQADIPVVFRVQDDEGCIELARDSDLLDSGTDDVDFVPAFRGERQKARIEAGRLRNQTVQIFARAVGLYNPFFYRPLTHSLP